MVSPGSANSSSALSSMTGGSRPRTRSRLPDNTSSEDSSRPMRRTGKATSTSTLPSVEDADETVAMGIPERQGTATLHSDAYTLAPSSNTRSEVFPPHICVPEQADLPSAPRLGLRDPQNPIVPSPGSSLAVPRTLRPSSSIPQVAVLPTPTTIFSPVHIHPVSPAPLPVTPSRPSSGDNPTFRPSNQAVPTQDVPPISIPAIDSLLQGANPMPPNHDITRPPPQDTITLSRAALTELLCNFSSQFTHAPPPSLNVHIPDRPVTSGATSGQPVVPDIPATFPLSHHEPEPAGFTPGTMPTLSDNTSFTSPNVSCGFTPITTVSSVGTRPLLGLPTRSGPELDPNVMPIPLRIQRVFNLGWNVYVPLDLLTNAACHRALTSSNRHSDSAFSLSASGELQVSSARFDLSKERHLTAYEFMQASKTLVWVIRHCLKAGSEGLIGGPTAQAIADSFKQHYDRIQHRHDFGEHFSVYLAYDIYIRHAYLQSGGTCSVHDWHKLVFEKKLQDYMTDSIRRTLNQPSDLLFGDGSSVSTNSARDSHSFRSFPDSSRSSSEASSSRQAGNFSRRGGRGFRRTPFDSHSRDGTGKQIKCMVCGGDDHRFGGCTKQGKILRRVHGRWTDSDGVSYCYAYNGPQSCFASNCAHRHACSLCGDGQHNAQNCAA